MIITNKALIVLNFYSRLDSVTPIIQSWKEQSVPCPIIVVDNRPESDYRQSISKQQYGLQDVWRWSENSGCPCHFYPPLDYPQYRYTLFADDDLIPGRRAVQHLLECANTVQDRFATIGQIGRRFNLQGEYNSKYSARSSHPRQMNEPAQTHLTCRAHLILTERLLDVLSFRNTLARRSEEGFRLSRKHDDFLMCMGLQIKGLPSYLIPVKTSGLDNGSGPKDYELIYRDLPDHSALWRQTKHFEERSRMVELALELGWKSLVD